MLVLSVSWQKDPHKYFIHVIDLTSLESDNQESNRYLFQGKEKMVWELNFTILLYDKTTCISSFVKYLPFHVTNLQDVEKQKIQPQVWIEKRKFCNFFPLISLVIIFQKFCIRRCSYWKCCPTFVILEHFHGTLKINTWKSQWQCAPLWESKA